MKIEIIQIPFDQNTPQLSASQYLLVRFPDGRVVRSPRISSPDSLIAALRHLADALERPPLATECRVVAGGAPGVVVAIDADRLAVSLPDGNVRWFPVTECRPA